VIDMRSIGSIADLKGRPGDYARELIRVHGLDGFLEKLDEFGVPPHSYQRVVEHVSREVPGTGRRLGVQSFGPSR